MAPNDSNQIFDRLGNLDGKLDGLKTAIEDMGRRSDESRAVMHKKIDHLAAEQHDADTRLHTLEGSMGVVKPLAEDYGNVRQRWKGILTMLVVVWAVGGSILTTLIVALLQSLHFWPGT